MEIIAIVSLLLLASSVSPVSAKLTFAEAMARQRERTVHYANTWAVKVVGGDKEAGALASKHGLINRGQVYNIGYSY